MKISELIRFLRQQITEHGDVALYYEENDGRSTYGMPVNPSIEHRKIWKTHSQPAQWYIKL